MYTSRFAVLLIIFGTFAPAGLCIPSVSPTALEVNQTDTPPTLLSPVRIRLPYSVRRKGGSITLRFLVNKQGKVEQITVVKFSDSDLVEPVYSAYESASYSPGRKNGVPVDVWVTVSEKAD